MYHMRQAKAAKTSFSVHWNSGITSIIDALQKSIVARGRSRLIVTQHGSDFKIVDKNWKGNRFQSTIQHSWFLSSAFNHTIFPGLSRQSHRRMKLITSISLMTMQLRILAKVALRCQSVQPLCCLTRFKWDEASNSFRLRVKENMTYDATWNVMVAKMLVALEFLDGTRIVMNIVMPPSLIKGLKANDMYIQHETHPLYVPIWNAVHYIESLSAMSMRLNGVAFLELSNIILFDLFTKRANSLATLPSPPPRAPIEH